MEEELLQFVWKTGLFDNKDIQTVDGQSIEIINRGTHNHYSGPDFNNAQIKLNGTIWYGNIEIHLHADDWNKHKHHKDPAYNCTILHVVMIHNKDVFREDGTMLPCLVLSDRIQNVIIEIYEFLKFNQNEIPCAHFIHDVRQVEIQQTIDRSMVQRLENKSNWISEWLKISTGDWHSVFMASLIRSFGFGNNSEAFEMLASQIPVNMLCRNSHDNATVNALIFGCAGFLNNAPIDEYQTVLKTEWDYLVHKYKLNSMNSTAFRHMKMRPGNFPEIRLAQLSALIIDFQELLNAVLNRTEISEILQILRKSPDLYWIRHYQFGKQSARLNGAM